MIPKKYDKSIAGVFAILTFVFLTLGMLNKEFLDWSFARHHNQLSWYIRPLFIIPFCYFAFKRSWAGISLTIFGLFTSMFWFPEPRSVSDQVKQFLQYEVDYLSGDWNAVKVLVTLLIPVSLTALGMSFWKRNLWAGLFVIVMMAVGKMIWSIQSAGDSGQSIIVPAVAGVFVCIAFIYFGYKRIERRTTRPIK